MISFIVAMDENRTIGRENQLPWHLPEDLKFFKRVTMGHSIAMGRKTHESIGRVLPGRENIVITRQEGYQSEGCTMFYSVEEFVNYCRVVDDEIFVIGGAEIYRQALPLADIIHLTVVHGIFEGDAFFPEFSESEFKLKSRQDFPADAQHAYAYSFLVYEKTNNQ